MMIWGRQPLQTQSTPLALQDGQRAWVKPYSCTLHVDLDLSVTFDSLAGSQVHSSWARIDTRTSTHYTSGDDGSAMMEAKEECCVFCG